MDRRKVVVGGGAAALAATVTALVGRGTTAEATVAPPTTTADHARLVLNQVNVNAGLVSPTGIQSQFDLNLGSFQTYFAQQDPDQPATNNLDGWVRQRMVDLCGAGSYAAAVSDIPQTRTLLAFSLLAYTQNRIALPQVDPGMPVPSVLQTLEPDFLPVLLGQINDRSNASPAFDDALQASSAELDRIVAANTPDPSGDDGPLQGLNASDGANLVGGIIVFILFLYWATGRNK